MKTQQIFREYLGEACLFLSKKVPAFVTGTQNYIVETKRPKAAIPFAVRL